MSSFVLVHGSWFGAWSWAKVVPFLSRADHEVRVVDLPSYGADPRSAAEVGFDDGLAAVLNSVQNASAPPVLVGHSRGGMFISAAAEAAPRALERVVYIAAHIPGPGQSTFDIARADEGSEGLETVSLDEVGGTSTLRPDEALLRRVYMGDLDDADVTWATALLEEEPTAYGATPVTLTADRFGTVRKSALVTARDHALTAHMQHAMARAARVEDVEEIDAAHLVMLSQPQRVADHLLNVCEPQAQRSRSA